MNFIKKSIIYVFANSIVAIWAYVGDAVLKELGEKEFIQIQSKSKLSYHGKCWHNALKAIRNNCDKLNDNEHTLLALHLANCFLEDSGHETYACHLKDVEDDRKKCINQMSDRAFSAYNKFYIYASHMCFFLNHEVWQAETQSTIKHLHEASSLMKEQLSEASQMQDAMLESQKEGLKIQNQLLDNGKELENVIQSSTASVTNMVSSFKESVRDQKELLFQIFSYLKTFQSWIISEVSWFQSIIYYTVSCIISALFTASKKTMNARVILFVTLSLNIIIERILVQYYNNIPDIMSDDKIDLVNSIWLVRKITVAICTFSLLYNYYSYKDEQFENFKVLRRIENRLESLQSVTLVTDITDTPTLRYSKRIALKRLKNTAGLEEIVEPSENLLESKSK